MLPFRLANQPERPIRQSSTPFRHLRSNRSCDLSDGVGYQPTCWSVRESNPFEPDPESGALPSGLTHFGTVRSEPMFGTHEIETSDRPKRARSRAPRAPLDGRHQRAFFQRDAGGSRTRFGRFCRPPQQPASASNAASPPGIEPGLRPSQSRVRMSVTLRGRDSDDPLPGNRTRSAGFERRHASGTPAGKRGQRPRQESNLVHDLRTVGCDVHHTPRANEAAMCLTAVEPRGEPR